MFYRWVPVDCHLSSSSLFSPFFFFSGASSRSLTMSLRWLIISSVTYLVCTGGSLSFAGNLQFFVIWTTGLSVSWARGMKGRTRSNARDEGSVGLLSGCSVCLWGWCARGSNLFVEGGNSDGWFSTRSSLFNLSRSNDKEWFLPVRDNFGRWWLLLLKSYCLPLLIFICL